MIIARYIWMIILGCCVQLVFGQTCEFELTKPFQRIFYEVRRKNEECTWAFIPPIDGPNNLLIIEFFYVNSYDSGNDKISLPNGRLELSGDISQGDEPICKSYLLIDDETRNCTNEFSKNYCKENIMTGFTSPMISSTHEDTSGLFSKDYLQFSFTYAFLDCPLKSFPEPVSRSSSVITTTRNFITDPTTINATTINNNETNTFYNITSTVYDATFTISTGKSNAIETVTTPQKHTNQTSLLVGVIVLALLLGVSWIVLAFFITNFLAGRKKEKYYKQNLSDVQKESNGHSNPSIKSPYANIALNKTIFDCSSTRNASNLEDIYSLAQQGETKEMVENVLYGSRPDETEQPTNMGDTMEQTEKTEVVENVLYHSGSFEPTVTISNTNGSRK